MKAFPAVRGNGAFLFSLIAVASAAVLASGCKSHHKEPTAAALAAPPQVATHVAPTTEPTEATDGTASVLAQKTESYAKDLAALSPRKTPVPAAEPTAVQWFDGGRLSLSSTPTSGDGGRTAPDVVAVKPVIDASPAKANPQVEVATATEVRHNAVDAGTPTAAANSGTAGAAMKPAVLPPPEKSAAKEPSPTTDALEQKFAQRVKDNPRDVSAQLDYQLLEFLKDEQVPQLNVLAGLPPEDRELVTGVLDGLTNFRNALRADNNMLMSRKVQPMLSLADRLRSEADLSIPTIALCTKVDGFGNYEPIEPARFDAGRDHPVIVYCEVANFSSQVNANKQWETKMTQEAVLYTETGLPVWEDKTKPIIDVCRDRRHDFFLVKMVKLPANLTIGRYLLKVSVVDQGASRVAEATVPIQIVAQ